jgi:hypothetical protein
LLRNTVKKIVEFSELPVIPTVPGTTIMSFPSPGGGLPSSTLYPVIEIDK